MSTDYEGDDFFPTSLPLSSDGDKRTAASVSVALEALADRTTYLNNRRVKRVARAKAYASSTYLDSLFTTNDTLQEFTAIDFPALDAAIDDLLLVTFHVTLRAIGRDYDVFIRAYEDVVDAQVTIETAHAIVQDGAIETVTMSVPYWMTTDGAVRFNLWGKQRSSSGSGQLHIDESYDHWVVRMAGVGGVGA